MAQAKNKLKWWNALLEIAHLREAPLGVRGERYAARYLRRQGMKILARNRTHGKGEIDLIALDGRFLVFVEVRTRAAESHIRIEHTIRRRKREKLRTTIVQLIRKHGRADLTPRLDVIAILWPKDAKAPADLRHYRNAFPLANW